MRHVLRIYSDNYDGCFISFDAYKEVRLQMSSGDFGSHTVLNAIVPASMEVLEVWEVLGLEYEDVEETF